MNRKHLRILVVCLFGAVGIIAIGYIASVLTGRSVFMQLRPTPRMEKMVLSGASASGRIIDCGGAWINDGKPTELIIGSEKTDTGWQRPENITLRNFRIRGSIRILGLGRNGQAPMVKESSHSQGHTARAQAAAPTRILISNVEIHAVGAIPLYLAPGVTQVTLENSKITGWSSSTAIYLDAESADNTIRNNSFALQPGREIIAIDGSANNHITHNHFQNLPYGGIYLYRNCGEGGTVRHQTPHGNTLTSNDFDTNTLTRRSFAIWLGSRNGNRSYCHSDNGYPFGSSADNRDFADDNTVSDNTFSSATARAIENNGQNNHITPSPAP